MKVCLIDNYDSFTYNVEHLLKTQDVLVEVIRNDQTSVDEMDLSNYDAFVFDFCDAEYNSLFKTLEYIVSGEYPISIKKGYHYGALHKI